MLPPWTLPPWFPISICGTIRATPSRFTTPRLAISAPVTAVTTTGAEIRVSSRLRAVTMTSSSVAVADTSD